MTNYKEQYKELKKQLKYLLYENESFQEALRSTQRQLLKVNRDKNFLLDRILNFEQVYMSMSESNNDTDSSEDESAEIRNLKRKKPDYPETNSSPYYAVEQNKVMASCKRKKTVNKLIKQEVFSPEVNNAHPGSSISDGHMTPEEVEKHLESRRSYLELVPEKAPPTVPIDMFSNDISPGKL
ncbi:hypothetical protein TKK_0009201 [Trichogramma kaykai]